MKYVKHSDSQEPERMMVTRGKGGRGWGRGGTVQRKNYYFMGRFSVWDVDKVLEIVVMAEQCECYLVSILH